MGTTRISVLLGPVLCSGCLMVSTPEEGSEEAGKPSPVPLGRVRCLISLFAFRTTPASQGPRMIAWRRKPWGPLWADGLRVATATRRPYHETL